MKRVGRLVEHKDNPAQDYYTEGYIKLSEDAPASGQVPEVNGYRHVEGVAAKGNIVNRNGRFYSTPILSNAVEKIQDDVKGNKFLGELEHPWETRSALERAAVKYTDVFMDGDLVRFKGLVLHTERGKQLEALLDGKVYVGVSTRGYGTAKVKEMGGQEVEDIQDDYRLSGFDFVLDPSNPSGGVNKFESTNKGAKRMTIDELKQTEPELFSKIVTEAKKTGADEKEAELKPVHEKAIGEAKVSAVEDYKKTDEAKKFESAFNAVVSAIQPNLPTSVVIPDTELGKKVTTLESEKVTLSSKLTEAEQRATAAEGKLQEVTTGKAIAESVDSKIKGSKFEGTKFEETLRTQLTECKTVDEVSSKFVSLSGMFEQFNVLTESEEHNTPKGSSKQVPKKEDTHGEPKSKYTESQQRARNLAGLKEKENDKE